MKTKNPSDEGLAVTLVSCSPLMVERIRASLQRGPFRFHSVDEPALGDEPDLFVAPVESVGPLPLRGVPVIAFGPTEMLRAAFLAGCADYLKEPWAPEELAVRAQAVVGRAQRRFQFPWGTIHLQGQELSMPHGSAALTRNEALIVRALLRSRGRPVPREALATLLGARRPLGGSRTIDAQIAAIRAKMRAAAPEAGAFIVCARGQGYLIP